MRIAAAILVMVAAQAVVADQARAQTDPVVRVDVEPSSVRVGEALSLRVTVLVPTFFLRPPVYPDFEVANAITRLPSDSSYATSERVGRATWSGIVREYRIYPLAAASYRLDGTTMRVTYSNAEGLPVVGDVDVPPVAFAATVPDGAEGLDPYVAGSALALTVQVDGGGGELAAGDAVVLTYRATLTGLPSVFLPDLARGLEDLARPGAVTVYADAPRFDDRDGVATRTERVTLVFNAGGDFSVPAVAIDYWDTTAEEIRTARAEPLLFSVAGPPASERSPAVTAQEESGRWLSAMLFGVLLLALGIALRVAMPAARDRLERWHASEAYAFRQLRRDLATLEDAEAYRRVQRWLEGLEPGLGPRAFASSYGDAMLRADMEALGDHVFGGQPKNVDLRALSAHLVDARRRYLDGRGAQGDTRLVPLNPG